MIKGVGMFTAIECKWTEHPRPADAEGLKALEAAEPGRVKQNNDRVRCESILPAVRWNMGGEDLRCAETIDCNMTLVLCGFCPAKENKPDQPALLS